MELAEIRGEIDALDDRLTALFLERMACSEKIAECKKQSGKPISDISREAEILARLTFGKTEADAKAIRLLYERIFEISRQRQAEK